MAIFNGGNGKDTLNGTDAADNLDGGNGKDIVVGGQGDDVARPSATVMTRSFGIRATAMTPGSRARAGV